MPEADCILCIRKKILPIYLRILANRKHIMLEIQIPHTFDLRLTLTSGQFFQWRADENGYLLQHRNYFFYIEQQEKTLKISNIVAEMTTDDIIRFFRLEDNLESIFNRWETPILQKAFGRFCGLTLIRQDPWECLLSFLCSPASNIPRITQNLQTIAKRFGTVTDTPMGDSYQLPNPAQLANASLDELYDTGVGFRARYLYHVSRILLKNSVLNSLGEMNYTDARSKLMQLPGVGGKVADCVLLFSLDFTEAFPVDTWISKILRQEIFPGSTLPPAKLAARARQYFGPWAGYAQQYLFHYARTEMR